jgi:hypothetical protein
MKRSHNFTGKICDPYHLSNRIFDTKKLVAHSTSKHTNVCGSVHIVLRKCRALVYKPALDVEVFRRNTAVGCMPVLVAIDDLHRIVYIGRNAFDQRNLILDGHCISDYQRLSIMGPRAHTVHRTPSGFNPDKIVSKISVAARLGLSGFADGDDTDNRRNPDRYSQDRQDASHLVPKQRHYGGLK